MRILIANIEKYFRRKNINQILNVTLRRQKYRFCKFCSGSVCLKRFSENIFISVRPMQIQTKVHFKSSQCLAVTFEMGC